MRTDLHRCILAQVGVDVWEEIPSAWWELNYYAKYSESIKWTIFRHILRLWQFTKHWITYRNWHLQDGEGLYSFNQMSQMSHLMPNELLTKQQITIPLIYIQDKPACETKAASVCNSSPDLVQPHIHSTSDRSNTCHRQKRKMCGTFIPSTQLDPTADKEVQN